VRRRGPLIKGAAGTDIAGGGLIGQRNEREKGTSGGAKFIPRAKGPAGSAS